MNTINKLILLILFTMIPGVALADVAGTSRADNASVNGTDATNINFLDNLYVDWSINIGSTPDNVTAFFNFNETLSGNPALNADECIFTKDGTGGGLLCEGSAADNVEGIIVFDPTGSDKTVTIPNATTTLVGQDTSDTLSNKILSAANNTIEADTGDDATNFFPTGTLEDARLSANVSLLGPSISFITPAEIVDECAASESIRRNAGDTAWECYSPSAGAGDITTVANCTTGNCGIEGGNDIFPILFEGTADLNETTFSVTDPTADRSITFPDAGGEVSLLGQSISDAEVDDTITTSNYLPLIGGIVTGDVIVDNAKEIRFTEADANGANYQALKAPANLTANTTLSLNIDAATCSGDGNGGALTVNGSNEIVCSADNSGAGGSITVEEADLAPSVASVTKMQFDQADGFSVTDETGGQVQIDFTITDGLVPDTITASNYLPLAGGTITGTTNVDNAQELRFSETDANGANYQALKSAASLTADNVFALNIAPGTCTGDANGGALTINGSNEIVCSVDDGGAGGGSNSFATWDASSGTDPVADSTSDTMIATGGTGVTVTGDATADSLTFAYDFSQTLAGNPAYNAGEGVFSDDCTGGGFLFEGSTGNTNEYLLCSPLADPVDTTNYIALGDSSGNALAGDTATGFFSAGTFDDARLSANVSLLGQSISFISPAEIVDECGGLQAIRRNTGDTAWECFNPGDITTVGTCTTGDCAIEGGNDIFPFIYEGTANLNETTFSVTDPTADRSIVFPDAGGEVSLLGQTISFITPAEIVDECAANQSIRRNSGDNAWECYTSGDITTVANCTTGDCGIEGGTDIFPILYEGTANLNETTFSVTDPTADRSIVFPDAGGTVSLLDQTIESSEITDATVTGDDINSNIAGRSLTLTAGSPDVLDADPELYSDFKCINIDPAATTTNWLMFRADSALTITGVDCLVDAATSVVLTPNECDANGGTCTAIEAAITCGTTNTTEAAGIDNNTIDAGDWIRVTRGTVTGSPTQVSMCIYFTYND